MAVQVRVSGSPAVSIGLLFTGSSGDARMVGVTAEYVHYRQAGIVRLCSLSVHVKEGTCVQQYVYCNMYCVQLCDCDCILYVHSNMY